jgi:hypothetical protein
MPGYEFVPLPGAVHREQRPYARLDRRVDDTIRLIFELEYEVKQPVHIGAGHWRLNGHTPVRMAVRSGDRVVLPGSSMKGILRTRYEAMTKSCCIGRAPGDATLSSKLPVRKHPIFSSCRQNNETCAACALFGLMGARGRVAVHDFGASPGTKVEIERLPERFSPRPHHLGEFNVDRKGTRLKIHKLHGRKFYRGDLPRGRGGQESAEVIPTGTHASGKLVCTNVTMAEVGGLLGTLGFFPASPLRIGSAKAYPFGELKLAEIRLVPDKASGDFVDDFLNMTRAAFVGSPDYNVTGEQRMVTISGGTWR